MKVTSETETFWVLRNRDSNTFAKYLGGYHLDTLDDNWTDAKTAEHFDSRREAEECAVEEGKEYLEPMRVTMRVTMRLYSKAA